MKTFLNTPRRRVTTLAAVLVALGLAVASVVASTASGGRQDTITLRVGLFGDFGYHDLYTKYEATHPNIDIKEDIESYADHHANLAKHLAVGSGADDIESVEVGFIAQFKSQPNLFVNLKRMGANSLQKQWLGWKWQQSIAPNGAQIGLGTDVGSLAICYRRDLFAKAGLPTSRAAVSKLWPTWQKFIAVGKQFQKRAPKGVKFFDAGSNVFNAIIGQLNPAYYDSHGKVIVGSNP
jgi:cellobiose transport system substrate-binding protein